MATSQPDPDPLGPKPRKSWMLLVTRWLVTVLCCSIIIIILLGFERKKVTDSNTKREFNVFIQAAILALSLNFPVALKDLSFICTYAYPRNVNKNIFGMSLEQFRKLLQSYMKCCNEFKGNPCVWRVSKAIFLFFYVLVFGIGTNVLIILLGMAFTYDASNVIRMHAERTVRITSMEEFWPLNSVTRFPGLYDAIGPVDTEDEKWGIAHTYGEIGIGVSTADSSQSLAENSKPSIEQSADDFPNWSYHFREYSLELSQQHLSFRTERVVRVQPQCEKFPMTTEWSAAQNRDILVLESTAGQSPDVSWLEVYKGNGTTWAYPIAENNGSSGPGCGPRCIRLYAGSFHDHNTSTSRPDFMFYNCTVTISKVEKADPQNPLHNFPDSTAKLLGASIALETGHQQYLLNYSMVHYSKSVIWGNLTSNDNRQTADVMGRWVAGAIATMDDINMKKKGSGDTLGIGVLLKVNWERVTIFLSLIVAVQSALTLFAAFCLFIGRPEVAADEPEAGNPRAVTVTEKKLPETSAVQIPKNSQEDIVSSSRG